MPLVLRTPPTIRGILLSDPVDMGAVASIAEPINLSPGYVVQSTKTFAAINGSPSFMVASEVTLDDEGYYEVDVFDDDGVATRHPICIVDTASLSAGIAPPDASQSAAFRRVADTMAPAYPHGRVLPLLSDFSTGINATTDRAVVLEVRARPLGGTYTKASSVLAKGAGTWRSGNFGVQPGTLDIRLAVVVADADTVLT